MRFILVWLYHDGRTALYYNNKNSLHLYSAFLGTLSALHIGGISSSTFFMQERTLQRYNMNKETKRVTEIEFQLIKQV